MASPGNRHCASCIGALSFNDGGSHFGQIRGGGESCPVIAKFHYKGLRQSPRTLSGRVRLVESSYNGARFARVVSEVGDHMQSKQRAHFIN